MNEKMNGNIRYVKYCATKRDHKTVSHAELNEWTAKDFDRNGFYEELEGLENVRLYFDFDFHEGDDIDLDGIFKELRNIGKVFGDYFFAGYCTDEDLYNTLKKSQKDCIELKDEQLDKVLSFHVVYPDTMISLKELLEIMNDDAYGGAIKAVDGFDKKVYRKNGKGSLLRHPFANKYTRPGADDGACKSVYIEDLMASDLVVTPAGEETLITREQWLEVFPAIKVKKMSAENAYKFMKALSTPKAKPVVTRVSEDDEVLELLGNVLADSSFGHADIIRDLALYVPKNYTEQFLNAFEELYNMRDHRTAEDVRTVFAGIVKSGCAKGFCQVMANIKNKYYELHDGARINKLKDMTEAKFEKVGADDKKLLADYNAFMDKWKVVVKKYFKDYDHIHTSASEEKMLQKEERLKQQDVMLSKTYKRLYARKILYMCNKKYIYRKDEHNTEYNGLSDKDFKAYLKRVYSVDKLSEFNVGLKLFKGEQILESADGLTYPRYRDMNYADELAKEEFEQFCTMYKATFKHQQCADFALKIMIQDIASGFHDNSGIIKFYYGTGGNNKDCECTIYENIIGNHDLVFKTHDFKVLADEKNKSVVGSLYVQFNEMPVVTNHEKFSEFVNALKNYNEEGFARTRALYGNFENIKTNIRFQCNTNNPQVRDALLKDANDAIKRRFFVAERVHSDEWSDKLWLFCHDVNKCRALKMYIKNHRDELYTEKLNNVEMLKFFNANHELYDLYTESTKDEVFENLKEALKYSGCMKAKETLKATEETYMVKINDWWRAYQQFDRKINNTNFKSMVNEYLTRCANPYVLQDNGTWKRDSKKVLLTNQEMIDYLNNDHSVHPSISLNEE